MRPRLSIATVDPKLEICTLEGVGDQVRIIPNNSASIPVYLLDFGDGAFQIGLPYGDFDVRNEDVKDVADVDEYLKPAIEGKVRMLIGPRRAVIQFIEQGQYTDLGGNGLGISALLPLPGWRKRARKVEF